MGAVDVLSLIIMNGVLCTLNPEIAKKTKKIPKKHQKLSQLPTNVKGSCRFVLLSDLYLCTFHMLKIAKYG
jgi:hypothetical protein